MSLEYWIGASQGGQMARKSHQQEIQSALAPPGAGIPFWDRWLGRFFAKLYCEAILRSYIAKLYCEAILRNHFSKPWILRRTPWSVSGEGFNRLHEK
jgi:hypothetical protein